MKPVSNWRECWRWFSMNCMFVSTAVQGAWLAMPDDLKTGIPAWMVSTAAIGLLLLGMAGRLIDQSKK